MLAVRDLVVDIQGSRVLRSVTFDVREGELVCLVGRNGAGKTTTLRSIMGFRKPVSGTIAFDGQDLLALRPYQVARMGIGFAPEESEVFGELTVAENIAMATWILSQPAAGPAAYRRSLQCVPHAPALPRARRAGTVRRRAQDGLDCPRSRAWAKAAAARRADRGPIAGHRSLDHRRARQVRSFGHAVFIAELNIHHVPDFTDRLYVIERGEIIFAGKPEEARRNSAVARVIEGTRLAPSAD